MTVCNVLALKQLVVTALFASLVQAFVAITKALFCLECLHMHALLLYAFSHQLMH